MFLIAYNLREPERETIMLLKRMDKGGKLWSQIRCSDLVPGSYIVKVI